MALLRALPLLFLLLLLLRLPGSLRAASPPPFPSPGSEPTRSASVVLDSAAGQPRIVHRWDPAAIAGANLTEGIQETG